MPWNPATMTIWPDCSAWRIRSVSTTDRTLARVCGPSVRRPICDPANGGGCAPAAPGGCRRISGQPHVSAEDSSGHGVARVRSDSWLGGCLAREGCGREDCRREALREGMSLGYTMSRNSTRTQRTPNRQDHPEHRFHAILPPCVRSAGRFSKLHAGHTCAISEPSRRLSLHEKSRPFHSTGRIFGKSFNPRERPSTPPGSGTICTSTRSRTWPCSPPVPGTEPNRHRDRMETPET